MSINLVTGIARNLQRMVPSKNRRMLLLAASTRYSLVKGERIVRSVLTAQLRGYKWMQGWLYILCL